MSFKNERLGCDTDYDNSSQEIGNFPRHTNIKIYVKGDKKSPYKTRIAKCTSS